MQLKLCQDRIIKAARTQKVCTTNTYTPETTCVGNTCPPGLLATPAFEPVQGRRQPDCEGSLFEPESRLPGFNTSSSDSDGRGQIACRGRIWGWGCVKIRECCVKRGAACRSPLQLVFLLVSPDRL
jgi:hypothetical protein